MTQGLAILIVVFVGLLALDTPIAFVIGIATVASAMALGYEDVLLSVARDMGNGLDSFALLAIPFFILAGDLMGAGGLARRLIDFASAFLGRFEAQEDHGRRTAGALNYLLSVGRDHDHRRAMLHQRERPMSELARRETLGARIRERRQGDRACKRERVVDSST